MDRFKWVLLAVFGLAATALACNAPFELTPPLLATATPTSTATFTPTSTPSPTPTFTPTPTPTPSPTPDPAEWFALGNQLMDVGDYATAAETFQEVQALPYADDELAAQARFDLGVTYLRDERYADAVDAFQDFIVASPASERAPDAHFLLAEALVGAGQPLTATKAYRAYLSSGTVITSYVNEWLGDAFHAGGEYLTATEVYSDAIAGAPDLSFEVGVREKLALTYVAMEDYDAAVAQYDAILDVARIRAYRARIAHQAAQTLVLGGATEAGYDRHLSVVETYPDEYPAYLSLVALVEAGRPVDDFLRGVVDYYGGAYAPAVGALYRYIEAYPETYSSNAHWYAGLSYLAAGSPDLAALEFQTLIDAYPNNEHWGDSWMALAEAHVDAENVETAVETYRRFVEAAPDHPRAPEALWEAAQLLEREGDLESAAESYMDCHVQYPDSDYGDRALLRSGLQSYQLDELVDAAVAWDTLTSIYPNSDYRPVALLWLGKLRLLQGDDETARGAFRQLVDTAPYDYYGLRAAQLAEDSSADPFPPAEYKPGRERDAADQAEAETWLAEWLEVENVDSLAELGQDLVADPRLQRGLELWRLGHFQEAKWELEDVRYATQLDGLAQYQLALAYRDLGLYRSSILCAARVVYLSPITDTLDAPSFIARLVYPTYYEDLVLQEAERSGLDPLLVFALIRQESLFESLATSTASAHGLMQVIPPTGEQIATELGWPPDYETADLYRPYVSLRFGTYYLAQQRDRFDGRIDVALAAYNGGPFRAVRWLERAGDDHDLFLQVITLREPRLYIQRIKEHLAIYRALYGG